ncbi:MAG TPA: radical SAM protein [Bacteroidales bacterium]|nr:radical SAM protein [Bacteroidales bacterium]
MSFLSKIKNKNSIRSYQSCKAAEKSMRFGPGGRVSVCCHNNRDIIGVFPADRIMEIWNGDKALALRKILLKKFAEGCDYCKYESLSEHRYRSAALYDRYEPDPDYPVILDFKADNRCNLGCIMCSGLSSSKLLNDEKMQKTNPYETPEFIQQLKKLIPKIKEARFSGGEPFLSELYYQIWDLITELNPECKIVVQTNGTILNDRVRELLNRGNFHINISIDSFEKNTYEKIRIGSSFENVLSNISFFQEYCLSQNRFWGMTACAMIENMKEFNKIITTWNNYKAFGWFSVVWFPPKHAIWTLNTNEIKDTIALLNSMNSPAENGFEINNKNAGMVLKNMLTQQLSISGSQNDPKNYISSENFEKLIISGFSASVKQNPVFKDLQVRIMEYFADNQQSMYSKESYKKIRNFTSDEYFLEILELMDQNSISSLFDCFKVPR